MPTAQTQIPTQYRAAEVQASTWNEAERTIDVTWTTGARGRRWGWDGVYYEELEVSESAIRMDRLNSGAAPVLNSHGAWELADQIGVVVRAWIEPGGTGGATLRLSSRPELAGIVADIAAGIIRNISVGYAVHEYTVTEKPSDGTPPVYRATDWEPMEISFVPVPFDAGATSRSADGGPAYTVRIVNPASPSAIGAQQEEGNMPNRNMQPDDTIPANAPAPGAEAPPAATTREQAPPAAPPAADPAAPNAPPAGGEDSTRAAVAAERQRATMIGQAVRMAGLPATVADDLIARGVSAVDAHAEITRRWAEVDTVRTNPVQVSRDEVETRRAAMENAIVLRATPAAERGMAPEAVAAAREYRGMRLVDLAREAVEACGVKTRGMTPMEIVTVAMNMKRESGMHGTSDFPILLGNVIGRSLRAAYEAAPQTFRPIVREVSSADFRPLRRGQLSGALKLEKIAEGGEYKRGTVGEGEEVYSLATYGKMIAVTRQALINDDLSIFDRIPSMYGRAAADLESDLVWAIITSNAKIYSDNKALFHADHANLAGVAAAISVAALGLGRKAMRVQKDPAGNLMNIAPTFLIVPAALETIAQQFLATTQPTQAGEVNPFVGSLRPIVEPRLDAAAGGATAWYLAASPAQIDTIEIAYLEGQRGLYTETREGWEVDGMEIKARMDVGAAPIDHRGFYKNAGA